MRKARRSKVRIVADILKVIAEENGAKLTRVLYGANLSYERLVNYLNELKEKGLISEKEEEGGVKYYLTERGFNFLREFKKVEEFARSFGIEL